MLLQIFSVLASLPVIGISICFAAPAPVFKGSSGDLLGKIRGKWQQLSYIDIDMPNIVHVGKDHVVMDCGTPSRRRHDMTINFSVDPPTIDLIDSDGNTRYGIVRIKNDLLEICFVLNSDKSLRPKDFKGPILDDNGTLIGGMWYFERVK